MQQLTDGVPRASAVLCTAVATVLTLSMAVWAPARSLATDQVLNPSGAAAVVDVQNVQSDDDGTVSGTLVNRSSRPLRDVQLVVRYSWIWKNERSPGKDNPGRSDFYTVFGDIPPGGSLRFTYHPKKRLPRRSDGTFEISAQVVGFTEIGV
jgi:hypothetical protein